MEKIRKGHYAISLRRIVQVLLLVDLFVSLVLFGFMSGSEQGIDRAEAVSEEIVRLETSIYNMKESLYALSGRARQYVLTHDGEELSAYIAELGLSEEKKEHLVETGSHFQEEGIQYHLQTVQSLIDQVIREQCRAILLAAGGTEHAEQASRISERVEMAGTQALSPAKRQAEAEERIFGDNYLSMMEQVNRQMDVYRTALTGNIRQNQSYGMRTLSRRIGDYRNLSLISSCTLFITLGLLALLIIRPVYTLIGEIHYGMPAGQRGIYELQFLASTYNHFREQMGNARLRLSYEASHDKLTGLYNRGAYNEFLEMYRKRPLALLIIDVDHFKTINDTRGHVTGDKVLVRVAEILRRTFRETDVVCRLGGDEFVILLLDVNRSAQGAIGAKIVHMAKTLEVAEEGLPRISISVGVAFAEQVSSVEELFLAADHALYRIKKSGRNGYAFYAGGPLPG